MAISNFKIEEIADKLKLPIVGVFSKDQLPSRQQIGSYYINMENSVDAQGNPMNGSHWIFARIFDKKHAIYFDPFGIDMPQEVRGFLKHFEPIPYNEREIQYIKSDKCGYFCLACDSFFTYDTNKKLSVVDNYDHFLAMFSDNQKVNDEILKEYLAK